MEESKEELEPLFDYSRVQPVDFVCLDDDDDSYLPRKLSPKRRRKTSNPVVRKEAKNGKSVEVVCCDENDEEDWLPPPPKPSTKAQKPVEDSTIKEMRLMKQQLLSVAQGEDVLRAMEESLKRKTDQSPQESAENQQPEPRCERAKIVVSIQDKDGLKPFRMYMDDKFERLFKMYADKVKLDLQHLVFCFDGDKISPTATPGGFGMEDNDIIEVHVKSS